MFSGIVQHKGRIAALDRRGGDLRLGVQIDGAPAAPAPGDSVAVNGVCLTLCEVCDGAWCFDLSAETLSRSLFGEYRMGDGVNIEMALRVGDVIGGHLVSGHVDGVATVAEVTAAAGAGSRVITFNAPRALAGLIAVKGSVCIDGVSLTVNAVRDDDRACNFEVTVIPHTQRASLCGEYRAGARVHIEADLIARYLERLNAVHHPSGKQP